DKRQEPDLLAMIRRIDLQEDDTLSADGEPDVTLITRSGASQTVRVDIALGAPGNPVSDEQLKEKFISLATRVISVEGAERIWEQGMRLDLARDINAFIGR
ncbi:MmgE/PrpD family protein, partial [Rahnella perminowiae]|nr:MmgE/PrpD family protein [Rahnella perminowiae]